MSACAFALLIIVKEIYWRGGRKFGYSNPLNYRYWVIPLWREVYSYCWIKGREAADEAFHLSKGGTGGFTPVLEAKTLVLRPGTIPLGRPRVLGFTLSDYLGAPSERYRVIIAGARSGKTTYIASALLLREGPAILVDPKLQLTEIAAGPLKAEGKNVQVMVPYPSAELRAGLVPASWNIFQEAKRFEVRHGHDAVPGFFMKMADFVVLSISSDPFWPGASKMIIFGMALHLYSTEPETCNLPRLIQLMMQGDEAAMLRQQEMRKAAQGPTQAPGSEEAAGHQSDDDPFDFLLAAMKLNTAFGSVIPDAAATIMRAAGGKTLASVLLTIAENLKWLSDPLVAKTLTGHTFYLEDLKTGRDQLQLFIGMPSSDAKGHLAPYLKLIISMGLYLMERTPPRKAKQRTAFIIDEVSISIDAIGQASSTLSGYGVELILATQGIQQLSTTYPKEWKEILGNADFVFWMGLNDPESPKVLMDMLGTRLRKRRVRAGWFSRKQDRVEEVEVPVMDVERIRRYLKPKTNRMIVTRFGDRGLKATNVPYYRNLPVWKYSPDPDWGDSRARAWTRRLLRG
jgi:type IV secretory pathway TraG/TraD family ATPase VirD4